MNWTQTFEEMTKSWLETQNQLLAGFTASVAGAGAAPSAWQQTLDAWKSVLDQNLDAQAEWTRRWAAEAPKGSAETEGWAAQGLSMMEASQGSSRQIWDRWFQVARGMDPLKSGWTGQQADAVEALKRWQDMARQMSEAQAGWLKTWVKS